MATLTYVYADQTAVLGPLATHAEPHTYDLCVAHAERLTVPRGWDVVRLATEFEPAPPSPDDLLALADAVREASRTPPPPRRSDLGGGGVGGGAPPPTPPPTAVPAARGDFPGPAAPVTASRPTPEVGRRGHLRVIRGEGE